MLHSTALTSSLDSELRDFLLRSDGQEDLCFAVYQPSTGETRLSALVDKVVHPVSGDREVHGNVTFSDRYFLRAAREAAVSGGGVAMLHSHPLGRQWQAMSADDIQCESERAAQAHALTGLPFVGLTLAGDGTWSSRMWPRFGTGDYRRVDSECVRIVGDTLRASHNPVVRPPILFGESHTRTVSAWGDAVQQDIARLRIGVVGLGSVGALVAEALMRTGVRNVVLIDYDSVKEKNLDRLVNATRLDALVSRAKVAVAASAMKRAHVSDLSVTTAESSVTEEDGFRRALDCDLLFSCVDGHWPRFVLNTIAYAHAIPVVDGAILVSTGEHGMIGAHWFARLAGPERRCLECGDAYKSELVGYEMSGLADDPRYIAGLPADHDFRGGENVFVFSVACTSQELLQLLLMLVAPSGIGNIGSQRYQLIEGLTKKYTDDCLPDCQYSGEWLLSGDNCPIRPLGADSRAQRERSRRREHQSSWRVRIALAALSLGDRCIDRLTRILGERKRRSEEN